MTTKTAKTETMKTQATQSASVTKQIPKTNPNITARVSDDVKDTIKNLAQEQGVGLAEWVTAALTYASGNNPQGKPFRVVRTLDIGF